MDRFLTWTTCKMIPFDSALWQTEFDQAVQAADLDKVYEMIGNVPE